MSIQDEAARVIGNVHANPVKSSRPPVIAEALADAGLLREELPEPNKVYESGTASWWDGPEASPGHVDIGEYPVLTPGIARIVAHQILAAAKYAEEGTNA